ncbi:MULTISPECIES: hypothetical protein [unclassified Mesorhizobium]|uniref:hypothetical protein n=1 Tax=unclassified Mesorhizobium TaxID=325217 RepID=UPI0030142198
MSNGLTSVFIDVLALAASSLASTARECQIAAWIASKDQGVYGPGTVGFDIADIPWEAENFTDHRAFLIRSIAAAKSKVDWDRLGYEPNEAWLMPCLDEFRVLLAEFRPDDISASASMIGLAPSSQFEFERCSVHGIVQHTFGCPLCNAQ